ncbi:MAG: 30S ribosomal protein S20 [Verrucomicrobiota bacterium]
MPNTKSAERQMRSSLRKQAHNQTVKSRVKTLEKSFLSLITGGKKDDAAKALRDVSSALDKAVKSGVLRRPTVNRKKSRLTAQLNKVK